MIRAWNGKLDSPEVLLHNPIGILILKRQHTAPGVLDEDDLGGAEELLADDDGAETVDGGGASLELVLAPPYCFQVKKKAERKLTLRIT